MSLFRRSRHDVSYFAGIIASKRCNNVEIYNNEVYDGDQAGIFLHRSSDDAKVYSE